MLDEMLTFFAGTSTTGLVKTHCLRYHCRAGKMMVSHLRFLLRGIKRKVFHLSDWNAKSATWCSTFESGWGHANKALNRSKLWMS